MSILDVGVYLLVQQIATDPKLAEEFPAYAQAARELVDAHTVALEKKLDYLLAQEKGGGTS